MGGDSGQCKLNINMLGSGAGRSLSAAVAEHMNFRSFADVGDCGATAGGEGE